MDVSPTPTPPVANCGQPGRCLLKEQGCRSLARAGRPCWGTVHRGCLYRQVGQVGQGSEAVGQPRGAGTRQAGCPEAGRDSASADVGQAGRPVSESTGTRQVGHVPTSAGIRVIVGRSGRQAVRGRASTRVGRDSGRDGIGIGRDPTSGREHDERAAPRRGPFVLSPSVNRTGDNGRYVPPRRRQPT